MKIVVIDNFDSFVYNLVRYVKETPETEVLVLRNNSIDYEQLENCDGILLSPGPGIPEEAGELMQVIDKFHQVKPMLGVCLGHQALGQYFGARLIRSQNPVHGKKSIAINLCSKTLFKNIDSQFDVGRYHSWILDKKLAKELTVTSTLINGEIMGFRHKDLPIEGMQFHPESILTPDGRSMIRNWVKDIHSLKQEV